MFLKNIFFCSLCFLALNCLATRLVRAGQDSPYTIQVETVSFEPAARAVVNRMSARGYEAYFESQAVADGKMIYKVRFGRFATREQADMAAQDYRKHEQRECFVVPTVLHPVPVSPGMEGLPGKASASVEKASSGVPVSTPALMQPEAAADEREFYTVQIAAKADRRVAQELVDRLHRKGYPVFVLGPDAKDVKPVYRIRIGSYETRAQAEQAGRDYAEREQGDYLVVLSPAESHGGMAAEPEASASAAPEPGAGSGYFFTVQVCVRETLRAAESYAGKVRSKGFEPYIVTYDTSEGKKLYRVRMGKFQERAQADELARAYKQQGGSDVLVVRTEQDEAQPGGLEPEAEPTLPESDQGHMAEEAMPYVAGPVAEPALVESEIAADGSAQPGALSETPALSEPVSGAGQAPAAVEPPDSSADQGAKVTKLFAYTDSGNELNLTNAYANIPRELLARIQYVSIFPVTLVAVPEKGSTLVIEVEGVQRLVRLSGIRLPEENRDVVSAGIKEVLSAEPLRLKYSPGDDRKDLLAGTLYYRSGTDLQIELLKRGLALVDEGTVPADRQKSLAAAQQRAQSLKAGIWTAYDALRPTEPGSPGDSSTGQ